MSSDDKFLLGCLSVFALVVIVGIVCVTILFVTGHGSEFFNVMQGANK